MLQINNVTDKNEKNLKKFLKAKRLPSYINQKRAKIIITNAMDVGGGMELYYLENPTLQKMVG